MVLSSNGLVCLPLLRVAEKESVNKMSLHNLATVFGPTLLRPSEKDSKIPANPTQPISMGDSWSLEVMAQVSHTDLLLAFYLWALWRFFSEKDALLIASLMTPKPHFILSPFCFLFPRRSRCCCISSSWRRSPLPTVNDRASSSPLKYRANTDSADLRLWPWRSAKETDCGSKWACSSMFLNWLTRFHWALAAGKGLSLVMPAPLKHKRAPLGLWSSEDVRSLPFIFLTTWYLVWFLVPSVMMWVHLSSPYLHFAFCWS